MKNLIVKVFLIQYHFLYFGGWIFEFTIEIYDGYEMNINSLFKKKSV